MRILIVLLGLFFIGVGTFVFSLVPEARRTGAWADPMFRRIVTARAASYLLAGVLFVLAGTWRLQWALLACAAVILTRAGYEVLYGRWAARRDATSDVGSS